MNFLLFSSPAFAPRAQVCIDSIKKFHPEARIHVEVLNTELTPGTYPPEIFTLRYTKAIEILKQSGDPLVILGADCVLFDRIDSAIEKLWKGGNNIILTPHLIDPPLNGGEKFQLCGHINADVIICDKYSIPALEWVSKQEMKDAPSKGFFYEQTWLSAVPFFFDNVHILRDKRYNVAYYNIYERPLVFKDGVYLTPQGPLAIMHFTGFVVDKPQRMSRHYNGPNATGDILKIYEEYNEAVKRNMK